MNHIKSLLLKHVNAKTTFIWYSPSVVVDSEEENSILQFREHNNSRLSKWYSWKLHIGLNAFLFIGSSIIFLLNLDSFDVSSFSLLTAFFFLWAVIEYTIHRFILHGRLFSFFRFKKEHSVYHHGYFTNHFMTAKQSIDTNRILLFPLDLLSVIALNAFLAYLLKFFLGNQTALIFFQAGILYLLVYEMAHALCHAPIVVNNILLKQMIQHHKVHHDQGIMGASNFSVVFPFIDTLFKTKKTKTDLGENYV